MDFTTDYNTRSDAIVTLFQETFTASEGAKAGAAIGHLVSDMFGSLGDHDMRVFSAVENDSVLGAIVFTRMTYPKEDRTVFILAPVAVATAHQGTGLGQRLIAHGHEALRKDGVDVVLTYGDVNFYSKVGYAPITETEAQPPLPLQYPQGWLGQNLNDTAFTPLAGPSQCVAPLSHPDHW